MGKLILALILTPAICWLLGSYALHPVVTFIIVFVALIYVDERIGADGPNVPELFEN